MSNLKYIEMEDDVREYIGECLPSAPLKKEKKSREHKAIINIQTNYVKNETN